MFLKVDADRARTDVEVEAMALVPVPTPAILWRKPHVLRWLAEHGYGSPEELTEVAVLRLQR